MIYNHKQPFEIFYYKQKLIILELLYFYQINPNGVFPSLT